MQRMTQLVSRRAVDLRRVASAICRTR
ncbi:putative leader peptide [Propioniciclava sp.]